jgi:hypothetical protein
VLSSPACRYSAPFREQVQGWIVKLSTVGEVVEQWLMVQVRRAAAAAASRPARRFNRAVGDDQMQP